MRVLVFVGALCALVLARASLAAPADCPPAARPLTPEAFARAVPHAKDRGMLWSITRDQRESFLYGTLHVGREDWIAPGPTLRKALRDSEVIALEIDPLDARVQQELAAAMANHKRKLPGPLRDRLNAALEGQCLEAVKEPSELQLVALIMALGTKEGLSPMYGSEILLSVMAQALGRPVVSLESAALQLRALTGGDEAEALHYIEDTLNDIESVRPVLRKTAAIWEQGDAAQLETYADWCECARTEAERKFMARLLDDRNPALADGIDALHMQGKRVLAAVGAMHMPGPNGLVALLERRGYSVRRLH